MTITVEVDFCKENISDFGKADINVLDTFHRNKALLTHVQQPERRKASQCQ